MSLRQKRYRKRTKKVSKKRTRKYTRRSTRRKRKKGGIEFTCPGPGDGIPCPCGARYYGWHALQNLGKDAWGAVVGSVGHESTSGWYHRVVPEFPSNNNLLWEKPDLEGGFRREGKHMWKIIKSELDTVERRIGKNTFEKQLGAPSRADSAQLHRIREIDFDGWWHGDPRGRLDRTMCPQCWYIAKRKNWHFEQESYINRDLVTIMDMIKENQTDRFEWDAGAEGDVEAPVAEMVPVTEIEPFQITVPDGAQPGDQLRIEIGNRFMEVRVPQGVQPGTTITVGSHRLQIGDDVFLAPDSP